MSVRLTFQITLKSDYHISAGHGLGADIDSALLRDGDGVPVVRGTTLVGLLRDGLWRLMQLAPLQAKYKPQCKASGLSGDNDPDYCGQFEPEASPCPVCRLFGSPRRSKRWFVASARPLQVETVGATHWRPGQSGAQAVQRARISPRTRRTEPGKLFSQEEGRADLTFTFTISSRAIDPGVVDEAALWVAAARNVRQLGRSRRRGQGECLFELIRVEATDLGTAIGQDQPWFLNRFAEVWLKGQPAAADPVAGTLPPPSETGATSDQTPRRFRLILRADEPLIIARRAEAGNQFETLSLITGQVLRGALAWVAARRFGLARAGVDKSSQLYQRFAQLFLRAGVRFPMLYPAQRVSAFSYAPTVPSPRNWLTCKTAPGLPQSGHGLFGGLSDPPEECPTCQAALTPVSGFITLNGASPTWKDQAFKLTPRQRTEMHVRLDPETGRAAEGNLFGYVALEAGQYFAGELWCQNEATWQELQALTGLAEKTAFRMRLGKASRRGYGQVTLWLEPMADADPASLILQPLDAERVAQPATITLTLLTDTIVTDTWGRFMNSFSNEWLTAALGMTVRIVEESISVRAREVDGFNAHLGLPRWRDVALVAGSAVRFSLVDPPADWRERLAGIEQTGLGWRCSEGFGQVAFNHPVYTCCQNITDAYGSLPPAMRPGVDQAHPLTEAQDFEEMWLKTLDEQSDWTVCRDPRFLAVARWLSARRDVPPAELSRQVTDLGTPDATLQAAIPEYGQRSKENKLETSQQAGMQLIQALLAELAEKDETHWPAGLTLLAGRIADAVEQKGVLE